MRLGLEPNRCDTLPIRKVPATPPKQRFAPIQDIWSTVIGPDSNGEFSEVKVSSAGDNQPTVAPWQRATKLTRHQKETFTVKVLGSHNTR